MLSVECKIVVREYTNNSHGSIFDVKLSPKRPPCFMITQYITCTYAQPDSVPRMY